MAPLWRLERDSRYGTFYAVLRIGPSGHRTKIKTTLGTKVKIKAEQLVASLNHALPAPIVAEALYTEIPIDPEELPVSSPYIGGAIEVINKQDSDVFSSDEIEVIQDIARLLAVLLVIGDQLRSGGSA